MSLLNQRVVSNTLNVLMQNWMQNSHAAIIGHRSGRGVTWDAFWTMCPVHKGWSQRGKALLGAHRRRLALNTETRATPSQPDGSLLLWTGRQGMKYHRTGHQLQLEGRQAQFPDAFILLGSSSACAYRGRLHCTATVPLVLLNKAALLPHWAVPPPLKGRSSTCSTSWLK